MRDFSTSIGEERRTTGEERKQQENTDVSAVPPRHLPRNQPL